MSLKSHLESFTNQYKVMSLTQLSFSSNNPVTGPEGRYVFYPSYVVASCKYALAYEEIGVASQNYRVRTLLNGKFR